MMEIKKPTLIVDLKRVERNIEYMFDKFRSKRIQFRPHFKTHQSHFIGEMYRKQKVNKCTVSSVGMAQYFAEAGWKDITIAFPANVLEANEINTLAEQVQLQILVDTVEKVNLLSERISADIALFIEIDTGYFRSGIMFDEISEIEEIIQTINCISQFSFVGFLSHTGNTYAQSSAEAVVRLFDESRKKLVKLKKYFMVDYPQIILSMGDTPAASLAKNFDGVDEIRPGNFVFYDVMQYLLGSCKFDDIATSVYCPVVAKYPKRNQVIIYGGGVHLSKEKMLWNGKDFFGFVSIPDQHGFGRYIPESFVESLSQEHGVISMPENEINQLRIGDLLAVYPVHSCMTVDLHRELISFEGNKISKYRTF